jgi:sugar phosphate isomerase/epimerase
MNHVLSTHLFVNHRLTTVWLDKIEEAGIPAVEIFCAKQHLDWRDSSQVNELGYWFRDSKLKLHSMHSPMYTDTVWGRSGPQSVLTITEPVKGKRNAMVDEIKRALEVAETIPFRYFIQHFGVFEEEYDERKVDAGFNALDELTIFARQRGVELLLENTPNALSTAERLTLFNTQTHMGLNFCFDAGHAHMHEGVPAEFQIMKDRIRSVHLHDNNGVDDQHLFPLVREGGSIEWNRTMDLLRTGADLPLLLELKEVPEIEKPLDTVREIFERLENLKPANELNER